jgi:subtilisin family serine protease
MLKDDETPVITEDSLSEIDPDDFHLKYKYNTINGFAGKITEQGLKELKQNPYVETIYKDEILNITLTESVPLINAEDVWALGVTGEGSVVCVLDTGIDYTHPDLGNCTDNYAINGNIVPHSLESSHPYANDYNNTWTITKPGFDQIAVHFSDIDVEYIYDRIFIKDASNNTVQTFTGIYEDVWSVSVPGDTIKINLVTDFSVTEWGFAIDKVLNGTAGFSLDNCEKVIDGYDFINNDNNPMDDHSHGTHVGGIIAANGSLKGVAPDAKLLALKVCNEDGSCPGSAMIAGIDWCNNHSSQYNIVATTMSIGSGGPYNSATGCPTWMDSIINMTHDLGITVTAASGNDNYFTGISYPACSPNAISVGSTTKGDVISSFTNTGDLLDLLAPGSSIYSTILDGYGYKSGTSMATPHVAGAVALLKQYIPLALPDQIKNALKATGISITDPANGLDFPRIDILEAMNYSECSSESECGTDGYVGLFCQNDDVWHNYINYTCNDPGTFIASCSDSITPELKETCGSDYCDDWQDNYCKAGDVHHNKTCYDKGCSVGACFNNVYIEEEKIQECDSVCSNGECIECSSNLDCDDSDQYTEDICNNAGTNESYCAHLTIACLIDNDCGADGYTGSLFCQNDNVYQNYITYSCNSPGTSEADCSDSTAPKLKEACAGGCTAGRCKVEVCKTICNYGACYEYCKWE